MNEDPLIVIAAYPDATQAHVAKGLLESEGIEAMLRDEHLVTANWMLSNALGGVRLMVPQSREAAARRLLQQASRGEFALDDADEETPQCPHCGARNAVADNPGRRLAFAALMFLNVPLPFARTSLRCRLCGHRWTPEPGGP
jgi:DNA-directed RNA polymerase subunit RPC12/RpoP